MKTKVVWRMTSPRKEVYLCHNWFISYILYFWGTGKHDPLKALTLSNSKIALLESWQKEIEGGWEEKKEGKKKEGEVEEEYNKKRKVEEMLGFGSLVISDTAFSNSVIVQKNPWATWSYTDSVMSNKVLFTTAKSAPDLTLLQCRVERLENKSDFCFSLQTLYTGNI